jgi:hypothetical protein
VPTPGSGVQTIYQITHTGAATLNVQHVFQNAAGFSYSFQSQVAARSTAICHVSQIPEIPSPFFGRTVLYGDAPFVAHVVGYDYPPTAIATTTPRTFRTKTPMSTATPTASPTATATLTPTPTPTSTRHPTWTRTATPQVAAEPFGSK